MAIHFFDTSALGKHYHTEAGTVEVDRILANAVDTYYISRLSFVEMTSVYAIKVRTGLLTINDFNSILRRFRADVATKRLRVIRMLVAHFQTAEQRLRQIGPTRNLRTLDSLQLAVAIKLNSAVNPVQFICADQSLCSIAALEGLTVFNPENPTASYP